MIINKNQNSYNFFQNQYLYLAIITNAVTHVIYIFQHQNTSNTSPFWDSTHQRYPFIHIAHHQECPSIFQILHYSIIYICSLMSSHDVFLHSQYQHNHQFHWKCIPSIATKSISCTFITKKQSQTPPTVTTKFTTSIS